MRVQGPVFRDLGKVAGSKELKSRLFPAQGGDCLEAPGSGKTAFFARNGIPYRIRLRRVVTFSKPGRPGKFFPGDPAARALETNRGTAGKARSPAMKKVQSP